MHYWYCRHVKRQFVQKWHFTVSHRKQKSRSKLIISPPKCNDRYHFDWKHFHCRWRARQRVGCTNVFLFILLENSPVCVCVCVCVCSKCDNKFQWLKIQRQTRSVWARAAASWHLLGWKIKGTPRGLKYLSPVAATAQQSSCIIADARAPTRAPTGVVHFFMAVVKVTRSIFTSRHWQPSKTEENPAGNVHDRDEQRG